MPRSAKHRRPWYKPKKRVEKPQRQSGRRKAQKSLRRKQRAWAARKAGRKVFTVVVVAALIGGIGYGGYLLIDNDGGATEKKEPPPAAEAQIDDSIDTTLVFGTKEKTGGDDEAVWLALLSLDSASKQASVIYIPAHTATEVPGHGLLGLGESLGSGGVPLLLVTTENLLGVQVDRYVELSDSDARVLFDATGELNVDVPLEVHVKAGDNTTRLLFSEGQQLLPSKFLQQLLFTIGAEGDEAELGSRHLAFWDSLIETFAEDPRELADAILKAEEALSESDVSSEELADFFQQFVKTPSEDRTLATLPVRQVSVGGDELYEVDTDALPEFMEDTLGSKPSLGQEVRVQILNGNGVPGIGEKVAEKLNSENFRVLLSGNARSLDYEETLIVTYDSSEEGLAIAERAQKLLGVGEVQVSAQGQGIVDLTIVVGKDFLRTE
ncbi:MAG TPA: LCP family protein [Actinomycetota bacterium]|nr:LCP family protein [Actinomycetota bacterium]